ncbi:MAG TPA: glycosyltransferase family 4 protein [Thermoanaerobaculia bacterium]|nr:glycosyltransferase family 4 protein [Thermoanaerobaculia bacterium]
MPLTVLITNLSLSGRTGTETYTRDLALGLLREDCLPIVYSTNLGDLADELRQATIPVIDGLEQMQRPPDVIHGHHNLETLAALSRFPGVPAVFVCHDATAWHSIPPLHPRVGMYLAVDDNCRDRMLYEYGIPESRIRVVPNAVDLGRFARRTLLPARPARALLFGGAGSEATSLAAVRVACAERGMTLDVISESTGRGTQTPEASLSGYDVVFAKARCALEALAIGSAVILCDGRKMGPMVTAAELDHLRRLNFGRRALQSPIEVATLLREIDRYDPADTAEVTNRIRERGGLTHLTQALIEIYEAMLANPPMTTCDEEAPAIAAFLEHLAPRLQRQMDTPARRTLRSLKRALLNAPAAGALRRWGVSIRRQLSKP